MAILTLCLLALFAAGAVCVAESSATGRQILPGYVLSFEAALDSKLQTRLETIDASLRAQFGMGTNETAVGLLDLQQSRVALIHPDRGEYAASVPKIGILLAYFQLHPTASTNLEPTIRRELELMIKKSNNEMAAKFSRELGLTNIQQVLNQYQLYDATHGGGIWVGKHYGQGSERYGDPIGNNSHAATVRQLLRFFLMLKQGKLVSPEASRTMLEIFAAPDLEHDDIKFVKGLEKRDVHIIRKWGSWQNWYHDVAIINGSGRSYILAALTHHPKGDEYLVGLSKAVDDLMMESSR